MADFPGSDRSAERQLCFPAYVLMLSLLLGFGVTGVTETEKAGVPAV